VPTLYQVKRLSRGYRYVASDKINGYGHVVGPAFGQVYLAEHVGNAYVVYPAGVGVGHFLEKHPDAVAF
jgi:hypothetical protein